MTALLFELAYYHWIMAGLICLVLDGFLRISVLMWLGLAAVLEGVLLLVLPLWGLYLAWSEQGLLFLALLPFFLYAWWRYDFLPGALLGRRARLESPLRDGRGHVRLDERRWPVTGPDLPAGTEVEIRSRSPVAFRVQAVDNTRP